jgi:hypothetical protein
MKLRTSLPYLASLLSLAAAPAVCSADDYRWELRGSFDRAWDSGLLFSDSDSLALSGTWYFAPVDIDDVPLAEAAFLGRASSLSAIAARFEVLDEHLNAQAARVGYYFPGNWFYAAVGVSRSEYFTALNSSFVLKAHDTRWNGTLGITPVNGLRITTDFGEGDYDPNLTARYVGKLANDHFYAGSVSFVDPEFGDTSFGLDFDYYFDATTSLGVGYEDGPDTWELRAEKFFAKSWAVGASAYTNDFGDGFGLHVTWRH